MTEIGEQEEEILSQIYGAALNPASWQQALAMVAGQVGASSAYFFSAHSDSDRTAVSHVHNHSPEMPANFLSHWHTEDEWQRGARRLGVTPGMVVLGSELVPTGQLLKTGFFNDFLRHHDIESMIGSVVFGGMEGDRMPVTHACWYRPPGKTHFDEGHRARLRRLMPHFQRGLRLQRRFSWFSDTPHSSALEAMYVASMEVNRQGFILRSNEAAQRLLESLPRGCVRFGVLRSLGARCSPSIDEALAACTPANPVRITAYLPGHTPQVVAASLVSISTDNSEAVRMPSEDKYLLLVELPRAEGRQVASSVAALFGLSAAEQRVLGELLEGRSPAGIADMFGTSMPTVRTQISGILAKTGTKGQTDLLLLLRSLRF